MDGLGILIGYLEGCTGPADLEALLQILKRTDISKEALQPHLQFSNETYTRNTISRNDWYELVVLCWLPGQRSQIHDHEGSQCAFKTIEGAATEEVFRPLPSGFVKLSEERNHGEGDICAARSSDIHRISNRDATGALVTLHIYSPPLRMNTYTETLSE